MSEDDGEGEAADVEGPTDDEEVPLSDLRERMAAERDAGGSPFEEMAEEDPAAGADAAELFEAVDVGDIDGEAVWDAVVEGDADPEELLGEEPRVESTDEPAVEPTETPDEHVVDKREYCQRCEYFADPPDAACTHEGTEIVEVVDGDHFRVRACPKVAADESAFAGIVRDEE